MKAKQKLILYLLGQGISLVGSFVVSCAIRWYVTLETSSSVTLSLVSASIYLPQLIMLPLGGMVADRFNSKIVTILSDLGIAFTTLILAVCFHFGFGSIPLILSLNCIRSLLTGLELPAAKCILPGFVPEEMLYKANSAFTTVWSVGQLVSPALAGIIMGNLTLPTVFMVDVITAVFGVGTLLTIPITNKNEDIYNEIQSGSKDFVKYIGKKPAILSTLFLLGAIYFFTSPAGELAPLLAAKHIGDNIFTLSSIELAYAFGSILISGITSVVDIKISSSLMVKISAILFGVTSIAISLSHSYPLFMVSMFVMGWASPLFYNPLVTTLQIKTDDRYLGRVMSSMDILQTMLIPLGMFISGFLANINISIPFIVFGVCMISIILTRPMRIYTTESKE